MSLTRKMIEELRKDEKLEEELIKAGHMSEGRG